MKQQPLKYWCCITRPDKAQSNAIMAKLLDLGANPSLWGVLEYVISSRNDADLTKIILKYNPRITHNVWNAALSHNTAQEYIDLLIASATPDEMTDGLFTCIFPLHYENKYIYYKPESMKQFINNGANHNIVLDRLTSKIKDMNCPVSADNAFVQNFNFLCEQKAFGETALNSMRNLQKLFGDLADAVESNQPKKELK